MIVTHAPLRHRTETGIDAVDDLVMGELLQKSVTILYALCGGVVPFQTAVVVQDVVYYGKVYLHLFAQKACKYTKYFRIMQIIRRIIVRTQCDSGK